MTPGQLAKNLELKTSTLIDICQSLNTPFPFNGEFSQEQVNLITRFVVENNISESSDRPDDASGVPPMSEGVPSMTGIVTATPRFFGVNDHVADSNRGQTDSQHNMPTSGQPSIGKYRLIRSLGTGGMGQVWLAQDTLAGIEVALKVLPEAFRTNPEEQERLKRSFQIVQALPPHPGICQLRDLQHDPALGYFLVMEYINGVTLSMYRYQFEQLHGNFPLSEVVRVLSLVADALDYAHDRKLIHRDIKPANVLISPDGQQVRVIDFQLAWEIRTTTSRIHTREKADNSGTYPYMAPELWLGQRASGKSDQYALAILTFELLDGRLPYEASDQTSWTIIVTNPNSRIPEIDALPAYAQAALAKALSFNPRDRFDTCRQFVEALGGMDSRETENFIRWKATGDAKEWVIAHNCTWDHHDWLQLMERLRRSTHWPMRENDIGELLTEIRNDLNQTSTKTNATEAPKPQTFAGEHQVLDEVTLNGQQINVDGYPPLSDDLLATEREFDRQVSLLKQVEDGTHPVLTGGRKNLQEVQIQYDAVSKDHERNLPKTSPGTLESIANEVSQDANVPLSRLAALATDVSQEDLYGYVQRVRRLLASKRELEAHQKQVLLDREALTDRLRQQVEQTRSRLAAYRDADFDNVCRTLFERTLGEQTSFPTETWITELPKIRLRRYGWPDQKLLEMAELQFSAMQTHRENVRLQTVRIAEESHRQRQAEIHQREVEEQRIKLASEKRQRIEAHYTSYAVVSTVLGFLLLGGIGWLTGTYGWITLVAPLFGIIVGAAVGGIMSAIAGAMISSHNNGHWDCCMWQWGDPDEDTVKGFAIFGLIAGAIVGILISFSWLQEPASRGYWTWSPVAGLLWGGIPGAIVGLGCGLALAAKTEPD